MIEVRDVVERAAAELSARYIFPEAGDRAAGIILETAATGAYALLDGQGLAERLTTDLQAVTRDLHLRVYFHADGIPSSDAQSAVSAARDPAIEDVQILPGSIGYLTLAHFPPEEEFAPQADSAMMTLADTSALIIDLRDCKGGAPASVAYMCSFFFDPVRPVHLNTLHWRDAPSEEYWAKSVPSYYRQPLYVLTSSRTFSGGEEFANNMRVLGRGILVGEPTRGGAHPGRRFPINANFEIFIPVARAENPVTLSNWEGTGVLPHFVVPADTALETVIAKFATERLS